MKTDAIMKALHNTMPSSLERTISPFSFPVSFDVLFIFGFSKKMKTLSLCSYAVEDVCLLKNDENPNSSMYNATDKELACHSNFCTFFFFRFKAYNH